jgi:hypothetical protein
MASIFLSEFDQPIRVRRSSETAQPWQAIKIYVGGGDISLSREEAAQLAVDLLNAAEAVPVEQGEAA